MAHLSGTVTKDAKLITTQSGKVFAAFDLVENEEYKDRQGNKVKKSYFYNCIIWNAEKLAHYITKGKIVNLEGNIEARPYIAGNGEAKANTQMTIKSVKFLGGGARPTQQTVSTPEPATVSANDDLPF